MFQSSMNLIWIDLEMTGLDTDNDLIIEIATVITDSELCIIDEGPVIAIHQEDSVIQAMDEWNMSQHSRSGLLQRVRESRYMVQEAENKTLKFVRQYVPEGVSPMCGSSICQDRRFMYRLMPTLEKYFHYRNLDVSSVKEIVKRWYGDEPTFEKRSTHLALDDVRGSITELKFYRENFFLTPRIDSGL